MSKTCLITREDFWTARPCLEGLVEMSLHWNTPSIRIPSWADHSYYCNRRKVGTNPDKPSHNVPPILHVSMDDTTHPYLYWFIEHCTKHRCTPLEWREVLQEWIKALRWDEGFVYCFGAVLENRAVFSLEERRTALCALKDNPVPDEWLNQWTEKLLESHAHLMD